MRAWGETLALTVAGALVPVALLILTCMAWKARLAELRLAAQLRRL